MPQLVLLSENHSMPAWRRTRHFVVYPHQFNAKLIQVEFTRTHPYSSSAIALSCVQVVIGVQIGATRAARAVSTIRFVSENCVHLFVHPHNEPGPVAGTAFDAAVYPR